MKLVKKNNKKDIVIVLLLIIIICLVGVIYLGYSGKFNSSKVEGKKSDSEVTPEAEKMNTEEALQMGKSLYDKVTEIYEVWMLKPYCGFSSEEISKKSMTNFGVNEYIAFYDSGMKNIDELKLYLQQWLSSDIVNQKVNEVAVTDLSKIEQYTDYVEKDEKLYCRNNVGHGLINNSYLNEYKMDVKFITEDKISYNIKSTYIASDLYINHPNSECSVDTPSKCSDSDKEYKDTEFIIEKNSDDKWIVSNYIFHE